jgi:membrane protein
MTKQENPTPKPGAVKGGAAEVMTGGGITSFTPWRSAGRVAWTVIQRFRHDDAAVLAAALAYTSLLSLVPLLTIGLAIIAAFPAFEPIRGELQSSLMRTLVPEVGQQVRQAVAGFIGNAGNLTAIGILSLVVTAVLLLVTIEDALNRIFRVDQSRPALSRLLVYWTVVTLGPILLGASLSITDWLFSGGLLGSAPQFLGSLLALGGTLFRFAMLVALFSLLYVAVPNRPVTVRAALAGGLLAAVAVTLLRVGFHLYIADFHAYQLVYGALAAIPILLFWMYLAWAAVLVGAELTATLLSGGENGG